MENRKKIDDLFKNELGNYTETPPPAVWDALEKKLDAAPSQKPRVPYTWFGYFVMVCALVAISVLVARNMSGNGDTALTNAPANSNNSIDKKEALPEKGNTIAKTATTSNNNLPGNPSNNRVPITPAGNNDQDAGKKTNGQIPVAEISNKSQNKIPVTHNKRRNNNNHSSAKYAAGIANNKQGNTIAEPKIPQPENEYNSSTTNKEITLENKPENNDLTQNKDGNTDSVKKPIDNAVNKNTKKPKPKFARFEAGIKGGYEQGFDNDAAKKAVISPYLQYKITPRFAIMLQPAIKSAAVSSRVIGNPGSYYNVNKDGHITQHTDSIPVHIAGTGETFWLWKYTYSETHDSIVKTNAIGGTYIELELPILLKYYVTKEFSVYGGVNIAYSKMTGITEHTYISRSVPKTATETGFGAVNSPAPAPPQSLATEITYTGAPYSSYTGPQYPAPHENLLRFGYMLGFSYEYNKKWLFDALVQQGMVHPTMQGGYNTNTPLSAPYIRLTVGYRLIK